jgi:adenylate kinase family enzyme
MVLGCLLRPRAPCSGCFLFLSVVTVAYVTMEGKRAINDMTNELLSLLALHDKVVIFGVPGAGKSTFALRLHDHVTLLRGKECHLLHIDSIKYKPHTMYARRPKAEVHRDLEVIIATRPSWIIEGNLITRIQKGRCTSEAAKYFLQLCTRADAVVYFSDGGDPEVCVQRAKTRVKSGKDARLRDKPEGVPEAATARCSEKIRCFHQDIAGVLDALRNTVTTLLEVTVDADGTLAFECHSKAQCV